MNPVALSPNNNRPFQVPQVHSKSSFDEKTQKRVFNHLKTRGSPPASPIRPTKEQHQAVDGLRSLPQSILNRIILELDLESIKNLRLTCRYLYFAVTNDDCWKEMCQKYFGSFIDLNKTTFSSPDWYNRFIDLYIAYLVENQ
jgi:hypothetical protein